jgi:L1 cell adhesion molecule like protein
LFLHIIFLKGTLEPVEKALRDAKMDKASIHDIVLVGGSTRFHIFIFIFVF